MDLIDDGRSGITAEEEVLRASQGISDPVRQDQCRGSASGLIGEDVTRAGRARKMEELGGRDTRTGASRTKETDGAAVHLHRPAEHGTQGADGIHGGGTGVGIETSDEGRGVALEGERAGAGLGDGMRDGRRSEDASGDEGVAVALNSEGASRGVGLIPEVGVEGEEAVALVIDGDAIGAAAADQVIQAREGRAESVATSEEEVGILPDRAEVAELEDPADGGAVQGMVDEENAIGVLTDVDVLLGEAVEQVAADLERAVVEVDRQTTGVQAERTGGGHADGAVVDTNAGGEGVLVVLEPERRAVDQARLGDAVLAIIVTIDPAGDDDIAVAVE